MEQLVARLATVMALATALLARPFAASQRTFVASYGSDASATCSLALPAAASM